MLISLLAVIALGCVAWFGTSAGFQFAFGIIIPVLALAVFIFGFCLRMMGWSRSPVPFNIATTGGQTRSLDWVRPNRLDSPYSKIATIGRMTLEILAFRSLFRNSSTQIKDGRMVQWSAPWLWIAALAFHYTFLLVFLRHFRFFIEPVPFFLTWGEALDGLMQVGAVRFLMTDGVIVAAILFLLGRRILLPRIRYISLPSDYFPLFLLLGVTLSGICMRYFDKTDISSVKVLIMNVVGFNWGQPIPEGISSMFYLHLFFVSVLLMYFPFSKLMHMGGVFLSPTRNLPANSRAVRHINPWNPPKKYRTYAEYEDEFREAMAEAGLPLEKEPENAAG